MANVRKTKKLSQARTQDFLISTDGEPTSINGGPERYSVSVLIQRMIRKTVKGNQ